MKTDARPTLNEVTAWLSTQPEIAYSYPWAYIVAALIVSVMVTLVGYGIFRMWRQITNRSILSNDL